MKPVKRVKMNRSRWPKLRHLTHDITGESARELAGEPPLGHEPKKRERKPPS